jgi:hypothetical protein
MTARKLVGNLSLLALSLLLSLVVAEALLRAVWPDPQPTDIRSMIVPDDELGHRLTPNSDHVIDGVAGDFSTHVRINASGFRSPEYDRLPAPGVYRVALFGDSEVFGIGVDDGNTLHERTEDLLNHGGPTRYQVLNFAMPAIGTIVQSRILEGVAIEWRPDAAVFLVTVPNDLHDDVRFAESAGIRDAPAAPSEPRPRRWARWKRLRLYSFVRLRVLPHLPGFLTPPAAWFGDTPLSVAAWYANDDLEADFALMAEALRRSKRVCDENGVAMYLVALPARQQFDPPIIRLLRNTTGPDLLEVIESDPDRPQWMLRSLADESGITYVEILDDFRRLAGLEGRRLKHPHDGHLNAEGTLEVARLLAAAIRDGRSAERASADAPHRPRGAGGS